MPAITIIVNDDGSISPGIIKTPGPNPTLDGVVLRPSNRRDSIVDLIDAQEAWDKTYWDGGLEHSIEDEP